MTSAFLLYLFIKDLPIKTFVFTSTGKSSMVAGESSMTTGGNKKLCQLHGL